MLYRRTRKLPSRHRCIVYFLYPLFVLKKSIKRSVAVDKHLAVPWAINSAVVSANMSARRLKLHVKRCRDYRGA